MPLPTDHHHHHLLDLSASSCGLLPKTRGRKPKIKILEEQNALDELRKKRKRLVTVLH